MGYPTFASPVLNEIAFERERQDAKWGEQNHDPAWWLVILGEEVGEACTASLDARPGMGSGGATLDDYRAELVQVAAVAVAAIECLDRNRLRDDAALAQQDRDALKGETR